MHAASNTSLFGDLAEWQLMLDRHADLFSEMVPGSSVGFVARADSGIIPGKHVKGLLAAGGAGDMLAWEIVAGSHGSNHLQQHHGDAGREHQERHRNQLHRA